MSARTRLSPAVLSNQNGFTLVESLVGAVLLAIGMLAVASLAAQFASIRRTAENSRVLSNTGRSSSII